MKQYVYIESNNGANRVIALVNRRLPMIGTYITEDQVVELLNEAKRDPNLTVHVIQAKD